MRLALVGYDDEALALVRWAVESGGHELVVALDLAGHEAEVRAIAPAVRLGEDWESLLLGTLADAVIVARGQAGLTRQTGFPDDERRAEQLRKFAQAAVPLLVVHPACEAIVGFEVEMIRRDSGGIIVPYIPGQAHPAVNELSSLIAASEASSIGRVEQLLFEREQADRSRAAVLAQFARDVSLLRTFIGPVHSVSATGPAAATGRDPLGPRPKVLPALANLSVHLTGHAGTARWSIGPPLAKELAKLTIIGESGRAVLSMPRDGKWQTAFAAAQLVTAQRDGWSSPSDDSQGADAFARLSQAIAVGRLNARDESAWLSACRDQEVAEAVDRSLARGRTIELFNEEHSEEESFKGIMAMGGCLLLVMALAVVFLATIIEGLRLPMRDWVIWQYWPFYLLAPIAAFLLLQLLQLVVKKEAPDVRQLLGPEQGPR